MAKADTIYIATESGVADLGDPNNLFYFHKGVTKVRADHPACKRLSKFFEPVDVSRGVQEWPPKALTPKSDIYTPLQRFTFIYTGAHGCDARA